jgi:hypothetical protein
MKTFSYGSLNYKIRVRIYNKASYILEEVICMGIDRFDDRVEVLDALNATVNQF